MSTKDPGTGEIKCRKHRRDCTPAQVHLRAVLYIIDKLDYLKHTLRRRRLQSRPRERMGRPASSNPRAANIFIKNLEPAREPAVRARSTKLIRNSRALFSPFTVLTLPSISPRRAVTEFALSLRTHSPSPPSPNSTSISASIPTMYEV